jgi:peptide/nickel transport system substrate-binding protein
MKKKLSITLSIVLLLSMALTACSSAATTATTAPTAKAQTGGWLDKIVFTAISDAPSAVAQLKAGTIDMYPVTVGDADVFSKVKSDDTLNYSNTYGSNDQILFNTADCTSQGILNPFSDAKIREAMNWAVDRNYVAQEIAGGLAVPKYTALDTAFPDAARNAAELGAIATKYAYNMDKAKAAVDAEMATLGATKDSSGMWQYKDKPVTVIGLIRTEDSRKQIGEYFANQLTKLGFTVTQEEKVRKEAAPIWQGDPSTCSFSYYTAGWINTAIVRDEGFLFAEFNSGDIQNIPVFLAYKPSDALKTAETALENNTFTTMDQRSQLFKTALDLSMQESWWGIWVIDTLSFEPYSSKVSAASDLAAGFGNAIFPYTVRFTGKTGGEIKIAQSGVLVQAWNPIQGSNWTDDQTAETFTEDHGAVPNPYTGLMIPELLTKMDVVAKTGLPIAKTLDWVTLNFQDSIAVPDDAWADWNATSQTFITAKDRAAADNTYKQTANVQITVTFKNDIFKSKWHDGSNLSVADFVMGMIMEFDPGKKDSKIYDEGYATSSLTAFMSHFKGVKIVSTDPLTITTWDDKYQLDAENNIYTWYPSYGGNGDGDAYAYGTGAWHNLTPAIQAEADGKMAFSLDKSTSLEVDQTSFISGPTLATEDTYLTQDATASYIPYSATLSKYITADEAKARYNNLQTFYKAHNNLWIGTGPYFVDTVDTTAGSITLSKFADYMYSFDQFSNFSKPEIAVASVDGPTTLKVGDEGTFNVTITFDSKPYPDADLDSVGYTLFGADGSVVTSGTATKASEGKYTITLSKDVTSKLTSGSVSLNVAVSSKVVSLPTFVTYSFAVTQ